MNFQIASSSNKINYSYPSIHILSCSVTIFIYKRRESGFYKEGRNRYAIWVEVDKERGNVNSKENAGVNN